MEYYLIAGSFLFFFSIISFVLYEMKKISTAEFHFLILLSVIISICWPASIPIVMIVLISRYISKKIVSKIS